MISLHLKNIFEALREKRENTSAEDKGPLISVNQLTGRAGALYEKVRYLVDYKEEHTIGRSAIERMIKRKLAAKMSAAIGPNFSLSLLQELVSGGYLPNKEIPEGIADDIQTIVNKYLLLGRMDQSGNSRAISLMASEIEEFLCPHLVNDMVVDYFYATVASAIKYKGSAPSDELNIQTYIGCRRSLLEDDQETLLYAVLKKHLPDLSKLSNEGEIKNIAPKFFEALSKTEKDIHDALGWKIALKLKNHSICFSVIKEIIKKHEVAPEKIFADDTLLEEEIRKILAEKYSQHFQIVNKSGTRAVIYILLTKIILAFVLELPYEKFVLLSTDYFALGTNIIFHPLLLFMMVKTIRFPLSENTNFIVSSIKIIAQNEPIKSIYIKERTTNIILKIIYGLLYTALFAISFGLILWGLKSMHFNVVSIILFLFFLTFVSYFGFRIRYNAKKWIVARDDESISGLLLNLFATPIVRTGRWLSRKFSSVNVFVFLMDFILEVPFKFVLGTFDSFISFLKEERGDPY